MYLGFIRKHERGVCLLISDGASVKGADAELDVWEDLVAVKDLCPA